LFHAVNTDSGSGLQHGFISIYRTYYKREIASFSNVGDTILTGDFNVYSPQAMNHMD